MSFGASSTMAFHLPLTVDSGWKDRALYRVQITECLTEQYFCLSNSFILCNFCLYIYIYYKK